MDKQLLKALDNLGEGLQALVEALQNKGEAKSDVGQAVQSGDFGKSLEQISVEIKSIKTDTQEILKNQQTLIGLAKKKEQEKKTGEKDPVSDAGDPKKTGSLKKGLATILLIAVAVLAIGLAFKIVGKINILSVIALGIGIVLVAYAFERVAKIKGASGGPITLKESFIASLVMVTMSIAVMISSKILSMISPITMKQALTAATIALLFILVAPAIGKMIASLMTSTEVAFEGMSIKTTQLDPSALMAALVMVPLLMITSSIGIMLSSKILSLVSPLKMNQIVTIALIAIVFAVVAKGIAGLITAFTTTTMAKGEGFGFQIQEIGMGKMAAMALLLPIVMLGISAGIMLSSRVLKMVTPIGFMQAITAILIAGMFAVVSMGIGKLINSLGKFALAAIVVLPLAMVAIALGIALSAKIFSKYKKSFDSLGWVTMFKILLLGVAIGAITFVMAFAIKNLKNLDLKTVVLLPLLLTLISLAVAASAYIFAREKIVRSLNRITFMMIFKIALIGIAIAIISIIAAFTLRVMGNINIKKVMLLPLLFTLISLAVAVSAFIFAKFEKSINKLNFGMILKILLFGIVIAVIGVVMAFALKLINKFIGPKDAIKGGLTLIILAGVVAITSLILNIGKYKNYPSLKWSIGVAASLGAFAVGALLLGSAVFGPQALVFFAGLGAILAVAGTIVLTDKILGKGNYRKYPSLKWTTSVGVALAGFAMGAILLGINVLNPFFWAGFPLLKKVAKSVVEVADILSGGKYNANFGSWAMGVVALYSTFVPIINILGAVAIAGAISGFFGGPDPFEEGRYMLKKVAKTIVEVSHILNLGNYKQGPTEKWAKGVSIAIGAFSPVYAMLVKNQVMKMLGSGGVGPEDFAKAIRITSRGIVEAAWYFAKNKAAFLNGPPVKWAKGVGKAIGAFAPVFVALNENTGWFTSGQDAVDDMVYGIKSITRAIIASARIFAENDVPFKSYPSKKWGRGVGESIKSFNPVFKYMSENSGWFTSGEEAVDDMVYGIKKVSLAIVLVAKAFAEVNPDSWKSHPSKEWAKGVSGSVTGFMDLFDTIARRGYSVSVFSMYSTILSYGAKSMADTARVLWKNRKYFTVKLDPNFIKNISKNILGFAELAIKLNGMLVTEKTVTSTNSGLMGIGATSTTTTVKERKDLTLPRDVAIQMASVAGVLYKNRKYFSYILKTQWIKNLSRNILAYVGLNKKLEGMMKSELSNMIMRGNFSGISQIANFYNENSSDDLVAKYSKRLLKVAKIIASGKKAFETKVDPYFMRKVGQNLIDFAYVTKKIAEIEQKNGTGNFMNNLFGRDPISSYTRKMITLAKGYDAMANALLKLGKAIRILKLKDLKELSKLTADVSSGRYDPEKRISPVKTKELFRTKIDKKDITATQNYNEKFDQLIEEMKSAVSVLKGIKSDTITINKYISDISSNPKESVSMSGSGGSGKGGSVWDFFSDERLKTMIEFVGKSISGINIYNFRYIWEPEVVYQGVIAQQLIGTKFESSISMTDLGFYTVDYSKLDVVFKKIEVSNYIEI